MKFEYKKVAISCNRGLFPTKEDLLCKKINALTNGVFAIHDAIESEFRGAISVTHLQSGYKVGVFTNIISAVRTVKELTKLFDWKLKKNKQGMYKGAGKYSAQAKAIIAKNGDIS